MLALSVDELLAWSERTHIGWRDLLSAHPEALAFPCDVRESETVRDVVLHIVAAELRYAERLAGREPSAYDALPRGDAAETLDVTAPSWRHDVSRDVDLIEDIARLRGYDALSDDVMPTLRSFPVIVAHFQQQLS